MEILIKAAVLGAVGSLAALLIKRSNPELSLVLILGVAVVILGLGMELLTSVRELVDLAAETAGLSDAILLPVLKCVGIGVIAKLATELCKDAGAGAVGAAVELAGAACALYVAMPLLRTLLRMIGELA